MLILAKALNGKNGASYGDNGGNGQDGQPGFNMTINVNETMAGSGSVVNFISKGGDGGDGGNGKAGRDNRDKIPSDVPRNAQEVVHYSRARHVSADNWLSVYPCLLTFCIH